MNEVPDIQLRVASGRKLAEEWALVLVAEGLSPSVWEERGGFVVAVPAAEVERAAAALSAYENENPPQREQHDAPPAPAALQIALGVSGAFLVFFLYFTGPWNPQVAWFARGAADSERILLGEIWRVVTALTLHADLPHVLANAVAGAIFLSAVFGALGAGLGLLIVLLAGAGGNYVNALVHVSFHVSVGASTLVFGALGVLGGLGVGRRRRQGVRGRHAWVPIAAGVALLAMLGTAGERVDLLAHLFGFLVGGVLGTIVAFAMTRRPREGIQWALGTAALAIVMFCWILAFR